MDAELIASMWMLDDEWELTQVHPELFNEQNFIESELLQFATRVTSREGAVILSNHPNSTGAVKAAVIKYMF